MSRVSRVLRMQKIRQLISQEVGSSTMDLIDEFVELSITNHCINNGHYGVNSTT